MALIYNKGVLGAKENVQDWSEHCSVPPTCLNDRGGDIRLLQALG